MWRMVSMLVCVGALEAAFLRQKSETGTIFFPLVERISNGQQAFVGEMAVGTPAQPMSVTVDIAGITFFPSIKCNDPFCTSHRQYDSSASSTYEEDGTPFVMPAGLNASGVFSKDDLSLSGVTVENQIFGEGLAVWNSLFLEAPNDGVLGLGFSELAPSILDTMLEQDLISERVAGLWLGRDGAGGEVTLGGFNADRYSGDVTWCDFESDMIVSKSVTIGNLSLCVDKCLVGATTIFPFFFLSMEHAKAVNDALGGVPFGPPGVAALDCNTLDTLPTARMEFAGRILEMSPLEYTYILTLEGGGELCISGFVGISAEIPADIMVGTLFFQKFFSIHHKDNMQVGLADSV